MGSNVSQSTDNSPRTLAALRAMIDAVDRDLLQLFARRRGIVADIAQYKREHTLSIRDPGRERELLTDRCQRASSLGLSPELIESIFRLVLWGSRDLQAALKAEVPVDFRPRTVAIIGGQGAMGRCMAQLFGDLGHATTVADLNTRLTSQDVAGSADVVVISVPIESTIDVIRQVGPLVRQDAILMDVTSIKVAPLEAMLEVCRGSVVGTHPLFSPSVHSLQGQRVVMCRGRGDDAFDWIDKSFRSRGLVVMESAPSDHDRAMSLVQVLVHFATEVMGRTLVQLGVDIDDTLRFTSPVYLMELLMTARHFAQSSNLYASIQMSNPATSEVTAAFVEAAASVRETVISADRKAFAAMFDDVRELFGSFTDQALEQSSFLIDRMVERT